MIMKKTFEVVMLVATLMGATLLLARTVKVAAAPPLGIKNVVLVHGAFADGSGWEAVAKILEQDVYRVSVAQPPEPPTPMTRNTPRPQSTPWAGRSSWSATVTAVPSSARPAMIQTLRHWSTLLHLRSMMVRAVRQSKPRCHKPPRHSIRIAMGTGG